MLSSFGFFVFDFVVFKQSLNTVVFSLIEPMDVCQTSIGSMRLKTTVVRGIVPTKYAAHDVHNVHNARHSSIIFMHYSLAAGLLQIKHNARAASGARTDLYCRFPSH